MNLYKEAIDYFDRAIKNSVGYNLFYHCNKSNALFLIGQKEKSLETLPKTQEINSKTHDLHLTIQQNIHLIKKIFLPLINQIEGLNSIKLEKEHKIFTNCENNFVNKCFNEMSTDTSNSELIIHGKTLLSLKEKLAFIEQNDRAFQYYDGFLFTMVQSYNSASDINGGAISFKQDKYGLSSFKFYISFIPSLDSQMFAGLTIAEFIAGNFESKKIKNSAMNICKLATTPRDFEEIAQNLALDLTLEKYKDIIALDGKKTILPNWINKFNKLFQEFDFSEELLFGERNETYMQRLGAKEAHDLISSYIATGKIYDNKPSSLLKKQEKEKKLLDWSLKIFADDMKAIKNMKEQDEIIFKKYNSKSCNCEIFCVSEIHFDDPLIEHIYQNSTLGDL